MPDKPPIRLHNKPALTRRRRKLRHRLTPAEAALWNVLKNSKLEGRKFRRQHSVGSFILDFTASKNHSPSNWTDRFIGTRTQKFTI